METISPILIGAAVAAVVAVAARRLLRARARSDAHPGAILAAHRLATDITFIVVGVVMMVLSVVVGMRLLHIEDPPQGDLFPAGAGIATDVNVKPNRGFVAGLAARFTDCDEPVVISLSLVGTAEFFEDNSARLRRPTRVTVAVPGTDDVSDVTIDYGGSYSDALTPLAASHDGERHGDLDAGGSSRRLAVTSISAGVPDWSSSLAPVLVTFKADWLASRGLGTCYLRLPPLVGENTIIGAQDGLGRAVGTLDEFERRFPEDVEYTENDGRTLLVPYRRSLAIGSAISVVQAGRNEIIRSDPAPNTVSGSLPAIACSERTLSTGPLGTPEADLVDTGLDSTFAIRGGAFARAAGEIDCAGVVTLTEAGAGARRDLVLLIVGAVFSIGAAVVLEVALDLHRRRMTHRAA